MLQSTIRFHAALLCGGAWAILAACGVSEESLDSAEASVLGSVLAEWCTGERSVIVEDRARPGIFDQSTIDFIARESGEIIQGRFVERSEAVSLAAVIGPLGDCLYMDPSELETYHDTAVAFRDQVPPPLAAESRGIIRVSRPAFGTGLDTALLDVSWAGGFGFCWSDYLVLRHSGSEWQIAARVNHIVC